MHPSFIRNASDFQKFVQLKVTPESQVLDFKATYNLGDPKITQKIATDVAAFANTWGGTIVIGVGEDPTKIRPDVAFSLVAQSDIVNAKKTIIDAIEERISPRVRVETHKFFVQESAQCAEVELLTVCIWPLASGLASVRMDSDALLYPYRHSNGQKFYTATEVVTRMDVQVRRNQVHAMELGLTRGTRMRIASVVLVQRFETVGERYLRLRAVGWDTGVLAEPTPNSPFPPLTREEQRLLENVTLGEIPADLLSLEQFELRVPHSGSILSIDVPIGAVRDLWQAGPEVGLALSCEIVISGISNPAGIFLRYPSR